MKKTPPRADLIHRPDAVRYVDADIRKFLMAMGKSAEVGELKREASRFIDFAERQAHGVFHRNRVNPPLQRAATELGRDSELDFADDVLVRAARLRSALDTNFEGLPPAWVAVECFGLANALAALQIEFQLGPAYSAGAKSIASGKKAAPITAQKRQPKIRAKHQKWEEIDRKLAVGHTANRRAELIAREVAGTPYAGKPRTIRQFLAAK